MCYPDGDFLVGDRDVLLGLLDVVCDDQPDGVRCGSPARSSTLGNTPSW